ncbi:MAG: porin [Luteolibacter sp.]
MKPIHCALLATSVLGTMSASAASGLFVNGLSGDSAWDKAWSVATLYKDKENPILQEFTLQGRLQVQTIYGEAGGDSFNTSDYRGSSGSANDERVWGDSIEVRRARFGFKSKWFNNFKFEGQIDVDTDADPSLYKNIYDLYVTYAPNDAFNASIGKTKVRFSREQEISSTRIVTFERALLSNEFAPGELTGIWFNGKDIAGGWLYEAGIYKNDRQREFTRSESESGHIFLGKVGYDYAEQAGLDAAVTSFHYMRNTNPGYNPPDSENFVTSASPRFAHSFAITNDITMGKFGLMTEAYYGIGENEGSNQSDVVGLTIIPTYDFTKCLQLVGRLQVASSSDPNGLRVSSRYERLAAGDDESGNTYTAAYLGLNYYIYGHKLKFMNGIEYSQIGGGTYDGYTFMSGLRMSF